MSDTYIDIVFDGPPAHESGRFIEVENPEGASIRVGEWIEREDGFWALRIPQESVQKDDTRQQDASTLAKDLSDQLIEKIEPHDPGCHCPFCDAFDALGRAL